MLYNNRQYSITILYRLPLYSFNNYFLLFYHRHPSFSKNGKTLIALPVLCGL